MVAYLSGAMGADVLLIDEALQSGALFLAPAALTELISGLVPGRPEYAQIVACPLLETTDGYWLRAGVTRAALLRLKLRARLPDVLIAQSCIDHDVALITRDGDFRHFAKHCGLKLA